jgi:sortase A
MVRHRGPRIAVRFLGAVLAVSGALLVLDGVVTLIWQEPISGAIAQGEQATLDRQLADASRGQRQPARSAEWDRRTDSGDAFGRISMPTLGLSYTIVEGVSASALRKGPGHYPDTQLPGERGTVAVAGHRTTYLAPFRRVDELGPGDRILLQMPYGEFSYRVEKTRIVAPTATEVTLRVGYDRLVLTACHPLYSAAQRIVVFARAE